MQSVIDGYSPITIARYVVTRDVYNADFVEINQIKAKRMFSKQDSDDLPC